MTSQPKSPSFARAALRVFDLSLGQMLWSKRTIFMVLVVGGPVAIAAVLRLLELLSLPIRAGGAIVAGPVVFGLMMWIFYLRFTVPVLGVFYGTALIADEIEDKTITYLFTRPVARGAVLLGKYLAYLACTVLVVLPSVVLVYLLVVPIRGSLGAAFPDLLADLGLLGLGLAVYGAVFAFVGARVKRPLLVGLVFALGWEPAALLFPGYLRKFTVAHYLQALVPHAMPQDSAVSFLQAIFHDHPSPLASVLYLLAIGCVFLALGVRAIENREYVLEQ